MTIDQAIKILQFQGAPEEGPTMCAFMEARKLGIEALKRVLQISPYPHEYTGGPMPGETEEE